jgi:hypothetical protein
MSSAPLDKGRNSLNDNDKDDDFFYENNYNISGSNRLSIDIKKQKKMKNKFENYINNKYNNTMFKNKNQYKRNISTNIYLDSINQVYVFPSHEYIFLIDFILYLCRSGWSVLVWR